MKREGKAARIEDMIGEMGHKNISESLGST